VVVLGISAGFHDSAAALVDDGTVVAAVEQERLSRVKHDARFPDRAMDVCLATAGLEPSDIDMVVCHERPVTVLDRYLATRLRTGPSAARSLVVDTPRVVREQLGGARLLRNWFRDRGRRLPQVQYAAHHLSHAAAAFYPSPFRDAAVLTVDGVGEWATATRGAGHGRHLTIEDELRFPHSLGLLYSAFTEYCGFRPNGGEGELMGLAPFGAPSHAQLILDRMVRVAEDGAIELDMKYFAFLRGRTMTSRSFHDLLGGPPRPLGAPPTQREADVAASIQAVTEEVLLRMASDLRERTGATDLCLGGGVALNCVANGRLLTEGPFERVWVQPAPGDAGAAVGAALWAYHSEGGARDPSGLDGMAGSFLGPAFDALEIHDWLRSERVAHRQFDERSALIERVAGLLADGAVIGWFQGRMEFGPRALGHRSILADARSATVQGRINSMVKERAGFRPFAPAVLADDAADWFKVSRDSPYMSFVLDLHPARHVQLEDGTAATGPDDLLARVRQVRSDVPAVTHVDRSARVQTVDRGRNPVFADLLEAFRSLTGCPLLLNTSFNARDEPIVCTPEDALATYRRTGLDALVLEDCLITGDA
jgi:carbamoyltransferase